MTSYAVAMVVYHPHATSCELCRKAPYGGNLKEEDTKFRECHHTTTADTSRRRDLSSVNGNTRLFVRDNVPHTRVWGQSKEKESVGTSYVTSLALRAIPSAPRETLG